MFEGYAMLILADMPISKAVAETDLSKVTSIAVDETSFKKGQIYVTAVIDAEERTSMWRKVEKLRRSLTFH